MTTQISLLAAADPMDHVLPHALFHIGPVTVTNHMVMLVLSSLLLLFVFVGVGRNYPMVPSGLRNALESMMQFIRTEVAYPALHERTDRFLPFLWSIFFFILFNNLLGLVPLDAFAVLILGRGHVAGTATAGLSVTAGLALVAFAVIHLSGFLEQYQHQRHHHKDPFSAAILGFFHYLHSFVPHVPGAIGKVLYFPLLALELILSLVKPFALAIRLFANMMAGHVVLASLLLLIPVLRYASDWGVAIPTLIMCTLLSVLELFVAFLQAYIFTFLTAMFIGAAVSPEH